MEYLDTRNLGLIMLRNFLIIVLFLLLAFQNIVSVILSPFISIVPIIFIKDFLIIFLLMLFAVSFLFTFMFSRINNIFGYLDICMILWILVICVYIFYPDASNLTSKIISARQLLIVPSFFFVGRLMGKVELWSLNKVVLAISLLVVLFGFFEMIFLGDTFWQKFGINSYMMQKRMGQWAYGPGGLPGNFYTYDFVEWVGRPLRRNVTLLVEPTLSGHFLSYVVVLSFLTRNWIIFVLCFVALLLTFSKGGLVVVFISLGIFALSNKSLFFRFIFILCSFFLFVVIVFFFMEHSQSVRNHVAGLLYNFLLMFKFPLGCGLGRSGNFAKLFSPETEIGIGESYLGAFVGQIGIVGFIIYLWLLSHLYYLSISEQRKLHSIVLAVAFSTCVVASLSESSISYIGSGYIFFLLGLVYTKHIIWRRWYGQKSLVFV
ncbi:hypothetical protein G3N55_06755 [Dissulfurirhabdus thermomarina]|uniref:O-antigen ligase family protein n=1 Tax=Dissulfurirhabdus thermomarina TaxID=1765737 RepID=A0A6N9TQ18_DISTH|nr:hypothetical protein [Dissulfurirhabdus thermomarina]NDY42540.1 hypothetical protein [Dissulfurirhabdus thermomarina]NMX23538.1 hypothetical protein [Dissulfurirhabdus thermomarina]